jgi:segregation and condensation protein B
MDEMEVQGQIEQPASDETESFGEASLPEPTEAEPIIPSMDLTELVDDRPLAADDADLKAMLEAIVYITDEPLTTQQLSAALSQPIDRIKRLLDELVTEFAKPEHGLSIREVAGGYKMATKAEHHEAVRAFVKKLTPPLKLSLPALETLAVIAYKQPVTAPEIMEIRGVQGVGVLKTLLDRKLIAEGGRKNVVGKPILYKTTKEFLVQFGLKGLTELPTLKEFEELGRLELVEEPLEEKPEQLTLEPVAAESENAAIQPDAVVEEAASLPEASASDDLGADVTDSDTTDHPPAPDSEKTS